MAEVRRKAKGRKADKRGRSKNACKAYRLSQRREHNKVKRLVKHLRRFPADKVAVAAVERYRFVIKHH